MGWLKQFGFYGRSFLFFVILALVGLTILYFHPLRATAPVSPDASSTAPTYDLDITVTPTGDFYVGKAKISPEQIIGTSTFRYRYQVINRPKDILSSFSVAVHLPKPVTEDLISHQFINNGGASNALSQLADNQTIVYMAKDVGSESQLTIEMELPKTYFDQTALSRIKQTVTTMPPIVWTSVSIALPALTGLLLLIVALARLRKVTLPPVKELTDPPSRLAPALLGILLRGRISSREVAATLVDLARRGHLVIHQVSGNDFRFRRQPSPDKLDDFEAVLLDQIFGPAGEKISSEEISFSLAQELFSRQVSQSFILAYKKINDLGYFYTNPLTLHRRYQVSAIFLFSLGLIGFVLNLLVFSDLSQFVLFWLGMMIAALMVYFFARGLPVRSIYGDRELGRWLVFRRFLTDPQLINYAAHSQEKYLAYLPYAIVFETEVEWTKRFYDLPFAQPGWYIAANITTIDEFANHVFPLFGYLAHTLAISSQPAAR
jgi:hypothetical protein